MGVKPCNKKKFTRGQVMGFLNSLKEKGTYIKKPWRNEVSYYKCEDCKWWHSSSKVGPDAETLMGKGVTYFEHQKDKWGGFLKNFSAKMGVIQTRTKKKKK